MFCPNCGTQNEDTNRFCKMCGNKLNAQIQQIPVQQQVEQAPVQEPVEQAPAQEPVEQAQAQEPVEQAPVQEPVEQAPVQEPVEQAHAQEPVEQAPVQEPVEQAPVQEPVEQAPIQDSEEQQYQQQQYQQQQYQQQQYQQQQYQQQQYQQQQYQQQQYQQQQYQQQQYQQHQYQQQYQQEAYYDNVTPVVKERRTDNSKVLMIISALLSVVVIVASFMSWIRIDTSDRLEKIARNLGVNDIEKINGAEDVFEDVDEVQETVDDIIDRYDGMHEEYSMLSMNDFVSGVKDRLGYMYEFAEALPKTKNDIEQLDMALDGIDVFVKGLNILNIVIISAAALLIIHAFLVTILKRSTILVGVFGSIVAIASSGLVIGIITVANNLIKDLDRNFREIATLNTTHWVYVVFIASALNIVIAIAGRKRKKVK